MRFPRRMKVSIHAQSLEPRRFLSVATPTFAAPAALAVGGTPVAVVVGDFNHDAKPDIAVADSANNQVKVFFGQGGGAFTAGPVLSLPGRPTDLVSLDINADGTPDLEAVVDLSSGTTSQGEVTVFRSNGDGTFSGAFNAPVASVANASSDVFRLAGGDFGGGTTTDLAVADYAGSTVTILTGQNSGQFSNGARYAVATAPDAITTADFNNDGKIDLVTTGTSQGSSTLPQAQLTLLLGSTGGTLSFGPTLNGGNSSADAVAAGDFNKDGLPDILVGTANSAASLLSNSSGLTFADTQNINLAGTPLAITTGDFNFDGSLDAVATGNVSNTVTVLTNNGSGTLSSQTLQTGTAPVQAAVGDFNNDGKADLAVANAGAGTLSIILNTTAGVVLQSTSTTLSASTTSVPTDQPFTVTATVAAAGAILDSGGGTPTGAVNFYDRSALLGTAAIESGSNTATLLTSIHGVAAHSITATYAGDSVFAASTSAAVAEVVAATPASGPDLIVELVSPSLPDQLAAGVTYPLRVRVTNRGNQAAAGTISNSASFGDVLLPLSRSLAAKSIHLKPGMGIVLSGTFTSPTAASSDVLMFAVNSTGTLSEQDLSNNSVQSGAVSVINGFGTIGGRKNVSLTVTDPNTNQPDTLRLAGPGAGTISTSSTQGLVIQLSGTTAASVVRVSSAAGAIISGISDSSTVGSIIAPAAIVSGNVTLGGGVKQLSFASATSGIWSIGGSVGKVTLGSLSNTEIVATGGVTSLLVRGGISTSTVDAASFGSVLIQGNVDNTNLQAGANPFIGASVAGVIQKLRIVGTTSTSLFTAGIVAPPRPGAISTSVASTFIVLPGGRIGSIVLGLLDGQTRFVAASLPGTVKLNGAPRSTVGNPQFITADS